MTLCVTQCLAMARRTSRRCENDAAPGRTKCRIHDAMGTHGQAIGQLKEDAYRLGHVAISRSEHEGLLRDRERLKQIEDVAASQFSPRVPNEAATLTPTE